MASITCVIHVTCVTFAYDLRDLHNPIDTHDLRYLIDQSITCVIHVTCVTFAYDMRDLHDPIDTYDLRYPIDQCNLRNPSTQLN